MEPREANKRKVGFHTVDFSFSGKCLAVTSNLPQVTDFSAEGPPRDIRSTSLVPGEALFSPVQLEGRLLFSNQAIACQF
jgi:hypothetical protein